MKPCWFHLLCAGCLMAGAAPVSAQQLDYGRYESLFGEPVTVSGTGKPERLSDTPVVMEVITAEDIHHSGARDLPTLLSRLAGIDLGHSSPGTTEVAVRGYRQPLGSRVMVLLNGRQVYLDGFGEDFWSTLPVELSEIRQVEIIKGPQSALYGFNAVSGVINIVTFDPLDDPVNVVETRIGNHARRDANASLTAKLGDMAGVRMTVAADHVHDYGILDKSGDNPDYAKDPSRRSFSLNGSLVLDDGSRFDTELSHTDVSMRWIALYPFFDTRIKTDAVKLGMTSDTMVGRVNATGYYTSIAMPWVQSQAFGPFSMNDRIAVVQLSDLFKIGATDSFRVGTEVRHAEMGAGPISGGGVLKGDLGAVSLMWEHDFSPSVSMVNAVRYDHVLIDRSGPVTDADPFDNSDYDRSIGGLSVNSALIARITDIDRLRFSFAKGVSLPSLDNFGQVEQFVPAYGGFAYYGNPDLTSTSIYDYQLGWERSLLSLGATLSVNLFHQQTMKHITNPYAYISGDFYSQADMGAGSVSNGLELSISRRFRDGWSWSANYTLDRLHEHFDLGYRNAQPTHKVNLGLGHSFGDWEADLYARYVSGTKGLFVKPGGPDDGPAAGIGKIGPYAILSPRLAWKAREDLLIEAVAENMWPYRDSSPQRMDSSYYLSVKFTY